MLTYFTAVVCVIVFSAAIMFLIFYRMKVLNLKTLISIMIASLISAFSLPGIFYMISSYKNFDMKSSTLIIATLAAVAAYIILVFILSLMTSYIIPKISLGPKKTNALAADAVTGKSTSVDGAGQNENYLEQIFVDFIGENGNNEEIVEDIEEIGTNYEENMETDENNLEKAVDSDENIDRMGIENTLHDRESITIDECIEEAFRLKELGDSEGAIIYYMYALDKKPMKGLTFWIVLDICVMYKSLGQQELALDILNSYYDIYNDMMDISIKEKIETNLSDIQLDGQYGIA